MFSNFARNVSKLSVPLYGVSFISERGVLGTDVLTVGCDELLSGTPGTAAGTTYWPVPLACRNKS